MFTEKYSKQPVHAKYSVRQRSNIDRFYDLRYEDEDGKYYYFVLIEPQKEEEFLQVLYSKTRKLFLKHFGRIIHMGEGEPDAELICEMQNNFAIKYAD